MLEVSQLRTLAMSQFYHEYFFSSKLRLTILVPTFMNYIILNGFIQLQESTAMKTINGVVYSNLQGLVMKQVITLCFFSLVSSSIGGSLFYFCLFHVSIFYTLLF